VCLCAGYLASLNEPDLIDMAVNEFKNATNMTDQVAALAAICQNPGDARSKALAEFYEQWKEETLVCLVRSIQNHS
jgi:aminopeptidase N